MSPVAVVTGGGGGIGAAVAEELGRGGWFVVTLDPLLTLDGGERLPEPAETTAGRIVAAGGTARPSSASVTDAEAVRHELEGLVREHGRLDAVVNVAGITRPTGFASGTPEDWQRVLAVHLDGYRNVLAAALPIMAEAGRGRILGVTSGSGWRAADAGAYSCAKRAVAALTWQLGRVAPEGVAVNAMSPIAATPRMVAAAIARAGGPSSTGGLSLSSMPTAEEIGPLGAHLVGDGLGWCRGQVIFAGGPEAAVIEAPRLLEVVRVDRGADLDVAGPGALVPAEAAQAAGGASNPRFGSPGGGRPPAAVRRCLLVTDRPEVAAVVSAALDERGVACDVVPPGGPPDLADVDAVVVAPAGTRPAPGSGWEQVLAEHDGLAQQLATDAGWARAAADHAVAADRPVRLVMLTDATTSGGRSRAQAVAQLSRAGRGATGGRVAAHAVALEGAQLDAAGQLAAYLAAGADTEPLAGAELVAGDGWVGLRSHPRPAGSVVLGRGPVPDWFDAVLRGMVAP